MARPTTPPSTCSHLPLSVPRLCVTASYTKLSETRLPTNPKNAKYPTVAVMHEGERVLKALGPLDRVILLDERGRDLKSEELADLLGRAGDQGCSQLVFCIGDCGVYG